MSEVLLDTLVVRLVGDASRYEAMLARSALSTQSWATQVVQAGKLLTGGVVLPLLGLGAAATKAFIDVDDSMTKIAARFSKSGDSIKGALEDTARQISRTSSSSVADLEKGYVSLHAAGFSAAQSVQALGVAQKFAVGAQEDLGKATETLAKAQEALGLRTNDPKQNAENLRKISDGLLALSQSTGKSVEEITRKLENSTDTAKAGFRAFMEDARGTSAETAKSIESTFGAQTTKLWNRIKDSAFQLGEVLNPAMVRFNQLSGQALGWWDAVMLKIRFGKQSLVEAISTTKLGDMSLRESADDVYGKIEEVNKKQVAALATFGIFAYPFLKYLDTEADKKERIAHQDARALIAGSDKAAQEKKDAEVKAALLASQKKIEDGMDDDARRRGKDVLDSLGDQKKAVEAVTAAKKEQQRVDQGAFLQTSLKRNDYRHTFGSRGGTTTSASDAAPWSSGMDPTEGVGIEGRDPLTGKVYANVLRGMGLDPSTGKKTAATLAAEGTAAGIDPYTGRMLSSAARAQGVDPLTGRRLGRMPTRISAAQSAAQIARERPDGEKSAEGMRDAAYAARQAEWSNFSDDPYQGASFHGNILDRGPGSHFYSDGPRSTKIAGRKTAGGSLDEIMSDSASDANTEAQREFLAQVREKAQRELISRHNGVLTPDEQRQMNQIQRENADEVDRKDRVAGARSAFLFSQNQDQKGVNRGLQMNFQASPAGQMLIQTEILRRIYEALTTRSTPATVK